VSSQGCSANSLKACAGKITQNCNNAIGLVDSCVTQNCTTEKSACQGGTQGGVGGGTQGGGAGFPGGSSCTDLITCCEMLPDPTKQQNCFAAASGTDQEACTKLLSGYKADNTCP
jgi:hypothetical protein